MGGGKKVEREESPTLFIKSLLGASVPPIHPPTHPRSDFWPTVLSREQRGYSKSDPGGQCFVSDRYLLEGSIHLLTWTEHIVCPDWSTENKTTQKEDKVSTCLNREDIRFQPGSLMQDVFDAAKEKDNDSQFVSDANHITRASKQNQGLIKMLLCASQLCGDY